MIGNELGSLVLRQYMAQYGDFIQGAILMGTCGNPHFALIGKLIIRGMQCLKDICIVQNGS